MEGKEVIIKKVVKKGGHGGGHSGGAWKVAYADFVTALMAFFLLMWLVTAMKPQAKAALAQYFKEYNVLKGSKSLQKKVVNIEVGEGDQVIIKGAQGAIDLGGSGDSLLQAMRNEIEQKLADVQDQVQVDVTADGAIRVQLFDKDGQPIFPPGSAELTPLGHKILNVIVDRFKGGMVKVAIEGHTDAYVYSGAGKTNWELSTERASAARIALEERGFSPENLLRVTGYAATVPLVVGNPFDPRNRRISLLFYSQ